MNTREEKSNILTKKLEKEEKQEKNKKRIKRIIKIFIISMIILFSLIYYMRYIEPYMLNVKEIKIEHNEIEKEFNGFKIVHISDIHYNMTTSKKELTNIVNEINKLKPDILVMTGDLIEDGTLINEEDKKDIIEILNKINVTMNKYYIKGNHDYYVEYIDDLYKDADFVNLNNETDNIYIKDKYITISGYGSSIQNDFIKKTNVDQQEFNIALIHEPDNIDNLPNYDLVLAGHSHNSQINIPVIKELFKIEGSKKYSENYYKVNNTELYINQGLGTSNSKYRLFAPPTINFYRLMTK